MPPGSYAKSASALNPRSQRSNYRFMRLRLAALVLGLGLLTVSIVATVRDGRQHTREQLSARLAAEATEQAGVLHAYFERARTIDLLMARNAAFTEYYASKTKERGEAEEALAYLEHLYPSRIAEVCFIDRSGRENARVVRGRAASVTELSAHEDANAFFKPTFALPVGEVYQGPPYVSPDTREWVISNSTVIPTGPGAGNATVHFEISLESFRREAVRGSDRMRVQIVDARSSQVVIDTLHPRRGGASFGLVGEPLRDALGRGARAGEVIVDGRFSSFQRVPRRAGNANDWFVVISSPKVAATGWWQSFGSTNAAMAAAALLLLAFALSSLRVYQRKLRAAALSDELTGLPNRTLFRDRVRQALLQTRRDGGLAATLMIDLDRFKEVNDTLGHLKGDQLLTEVGARLRETLRDADTVARLGGDEFAVLIPRIEESGQAAEVAHRIAEAMQEPFVLGGVAIQVDMSVGIALSPPDGDDPDTLIQRADIAMYEAKKGNAGHAFYTTERDPYSARRLAMVAELRAAIEERALDVHYQPKVDLVSGEVTGVEALARWSHPELGQIPPGEFVPLAEQTGLIKPLTIAVLEIALVQARRWRDEGLTVPVSVNLSARNLLDLQLPAEVDGLLTRFGVAPTLLELEITESSIMSDPVRALDVLTRLDEMGVRLSIDDFGTGYSSLAYLKRLPVDELKIDRGFVMNMTRDRADAFIVRCAVDLGRNLGLRVVAEGVEDAATVEALAKLGCTQAQGYYFSRPAPAQELTVWLRGGAVSLPRVAP
jgi:diguanylate cyclase (GGDEF)-like protein